MCSRGYSSNQASIPAASGNTGFKAEKFAKITVEFVIMKITKNIMPPSVTPKELDSLVVLK
ncbi:DUF4907 domain-containing protein [Candidatus Poribacteria bacterium]|nr:DUF4907 domain-containing protein [Candidatus Poribacteria bacterium]